MSTGLHSDGVYRAACVERRHMLTARKWSTDTEEIIPLWHWEISTVREWYEGAGAIVTTFPSHEEVDLKHPETGISLEESLNLWHGTEEHLWVAVAVMRENHNVWCSSILEPLVEEELHAQAM